MVVYHFDRQGKPWTFEIPNCSFMAAQAFANVLRDVRRMGRRETKHYFRNVAIDIERVGNDVEQVILNALQEKYPKPTTLPDSPRERFIL